MLTQQQSQPMQSAPTGKMTLEQFGQSVKAKYPQYQNISDAEVGQKVLEKYPQYKMKVQVSAPTPAEQKPGLLSRIGNALTASEQAFGNTLGTAGAVVSGQDQIINKAEQDTAESNRKLADLLNRPGISEEQKQHIRSQLGQNIQVENAAQQMPSINKSAEQIAGEGLGVFADIASAGTYGEAAKAAQTGKLLTGSERVAGLAEKAGIPFIGRTADVIEKPLLMKAGGLAKEGAALGATFGASQAMQKDKAAKDVFKDAAISGALGGAISGAIPFVEEGVQRGTQYVKDALEPLSNIRQKTAERTINSLIKPLSKDLSYGKNPARGILEEGITFNSLEEGAQKVSEARSRIGEEISQTLSTEEALSKRIDISKALQPIDDALAQAKKTPRTNQALISRLENAKADILGVDEAGNITRAFESVTPKDAADVKRLVGDITKFTGNQSDDNLVNGALKRVYGKLKEKINEAVPELKKLNERYADLTSADIAIRYRDKIMSRQNIFPMASKLLTGGGLIGSIATFNPALAATTIANMGFEKAMSSPAFKTRFAQWLASASPAEREAMSKAVPELAPVIEQIVKQLGTRLYPAFIQREMSKIGS